MSLNNSEYSLADIAAATGNNGRNNGDMFGGNGAWWIIILFLFVFCGWGGNGFGGGGGRNGGGGTGAIEGYVLTSDFANLERKLDNVNNGLCDGFYAVAQQFATLQNGVNQGFAGLNTAMFQGFAGIDRAICNLQAQIASCCCEIQRQVEGVRYDVAIQAGETRNQMQSIGCNLQNTMNNNTRDVIDNQRGGIQAIMDKLSQMEYNGLNDKYQAAIAENQALKFQVSQTAQNGTIGAMIDASRAEILRRSGHDCPTAAYIVQPPTPVNFPTNCCGTFTGYNGGCGTCA